MKVLFFFILLLPTNVCFQKLIYRHAIDVIDDRIVHLLRCRNNLAMQTRKFKEKIEDPSRERAILDRLKKKDVLRPEFIDQLYPIIFNETKYLQTQFFS